MRFPILDDLPSPPASLNGWPWTEGSPQLPYTMPGGQPWPRISIVTPSYNQAGFIEETIRSVLLQGYPNLEYIVMDGGSTDGSIEIIRRYEPWLTYWVSEPDEGQADAINKGWRRSGGEIIAWINSDDFYEAGAFEKAALFLCENPGVDLIFGDCNVIGPESQMLGVMKAWQLDRKRELTGRNMVIQPSSFFRRRLLDTVGELDTGFQYVFDYDWWVRILLADGEIQRLSTPLANYRLHHSSKSVSSWLNLSRENETILARIYETDKYPSIRSWKNRAYSTYHRMVGEAHYRLGQMSDARKEFWRAIRTCPFRSTNPIVAAYILDTWLGTRLGPALQRMRMRLPDAPRGDLIFGESETEQWW